MLAETLLSVIARLFNFKRNQMSSFFIVAERQGKTEI